MWLLYFIRWYYQLGRTFDYILFPRHYISIGYGCQQKRLILREFGHIIGFYNEHQRPDRDDYEVRPENLNKLTTKKIDSLGEAYDYASVMHYKCDHT